VSRIRQYIILEPGPQPGVGSTGQLPPSDIFKNMCSLLGTTTSYNNFLPQKVEALQSFCTPPENICCLRPWWQQYVKSDIQNKTSMWAPEDLKCF